MLGLRRGTVQLAPYAEQWAQLFAVEQAHIRAALNELVLDIQHVGSTAVPGLCAKPILDIAVAVRSLADVAACVAPLAQLGYAYLGDKPSTSGHFFAKGDDSNRTHYLHFVAHDNPQWTDFLRFRDRLRADPAARDEYARLKQRLAARYAADRASYTQQKEAFVRRILADT